MVSAFGTEIFRTAYILQRLRTIEEEVKGNGKDLQDIKEMMERRENEEKWRRRYAEFGQTNASQLEQIEQQHQMHSSNPAAPVARPSPSIPAIPDQSPVPVETTADNPEDEVAAIEQFIHGLRSKTLLKDVRALWTVWNTGQFPTAVRAGVQLPRGQSWRELDADFYSKAKSPVDDRYRKWAGKVGGVAGPGVPFMGRSKRREFLKSLEQAINDPNGPGESSVLERVQAEVDTDFNGEILSYAAARFVGADRAGPSRQQ